MRRRLECAAASLQPSPAVRPLAGIPGPAEASSRGSRGRKIMTQPDGGRHPDAASAATAPQLRRATAQDLPAIVRLLADDPLGAKRERYEEPLPESYRTAFAAIDRDPNQELCVACLDASVVGVLQLTFIPYLTYQGGWRALIEGVRIAPGLRSRGLGRILFEWAIERARARGCHMVQLTSDKSRPDAIRFYQGLGFVASHEGMKLFLTPQTPSDPAAPMR
jgi:ribosomal protein S18 acetylase RimI-like enzyme